MKRLLFGLVLLCSTSAWADNTFGIDDFTITANEEKVIEVKMYNDVTISGFQFDLELPEGVSIKMNAQSKYMIAATNRLKVYDDFEGTYTPTHTIVSNLQPTGAYRVMVYSGSNANIQGASGVSVLRIQLVSSDQVATGISTPKFTKMEMTQADGTKIKPSDITYNCTVGISTTVTTLGYASFSWPKALDFTNSGLTAFIAKDCSGGNLKLEPVTKVPANTGLILKGTAGSENTYALETTTEDTEDVSGNLLSPTSTEAYTVASDNIYVLSNLDDGKAGFYKAASGIQVGKYKSYLQYPTQGARLSFVFDEEATAITSVVDKAPTEDKCYDLQGRLVTKPAAGMYIKNGKKYVEK